MMTIRGSGPWVAATCRWRFRPLIRGIRTSTISQALSCGGPACHKSSAAAHPHCPTPLQAEETVEGPAHRRIIAHGAQGRLGQTCLASVARSRPGGLAFTRWYHTRAHDPEVCHPADQGGALQAQTCRGAVGAGHHPVGGVQGVQNMRAHRVVQRL